MDGRGRFLLLDMFLHSFQDLGTRTGDSAAPPPGSSRVVSSLDSRCLFSLIFFFLKSKELLRFLLVFISVAVPDFPLKHRLPQGKTLLLFQTGEQEVFFERPPRRSRMTLGSRPDFLCFGRLSQRAVDLPTDTTWQPAHFSFGKRIFPSVH